MLHIFNGIPIDTEIHKNILSLKFHENEIDFFKCGSIEEETRAQLFKAWLKANSGLLEILIVIKFYLPLKEDFSQD